MCQKTISWVYLFIYSQNDLREEKKGKQVGFFFFVQELCRRVTEQLVSIQLVWGERHTHHCTRASTGVCVLFIFLVKTSVDNYPTPQ